MPTSSSPCPTRRSPRPSATAAASGIPHNDGLIKNRYIGRTFIEPTQDMRERGVALKFNALAENLAGKRVVMIDDSLVRGTTAGPLVKLLRDAGATEVHVRITCPPITHACHFGVDMGHDDDLMAARLSIDEIREHIGADSLAFLSLDGMMRAISRPGDTATGDAEGFCNACFTGRYPIEVSRGAAQAGLRGRAGVMHVLVIGSGGRESAIALGLPPPRPRRHRRRRARPADARRSIWSSSGPRRRWPPASPTRAAPPASRASGRPPPSPGSRSSKGYTRELATRSSACRRRVPPQRRPSATTR